MLQSLRSRLALVLVLITVATSCVVLMSWSVANGLMNRFDSGATEVVAETNFNLDQMVLLGTVPEHAERYAHGDLAALDDVDLVAAQVLRSVDEGAAAVEFETGVESVLRASVVRHMTALRALTRSAPRSGPGMAGLRGQMDDLAARAERDFSLLTHANTEEIADKLKSAAGERGRLGSGTAAAVLLLLGLFLVLAVTVQKSVLKPLRHFRQRVERLGRGDFAAVEVLRGPTEITTLARSFDEMAGDLQTAQATLRRKALHDELTGLSNRHALMEELARLEQSQQQATVLFIDLDNFKTVNDSLGHGAGDALLAELAARLLATVRSEDLVVRLGGDEFAVLLVESSRDEAERLSHRLLDVLRAPVEVAGFEVSSTASIGISETRSDGYEALLRNADMAMYAAKASGKGQVASFHAGLHTDALTRLNLAADLRRAFDRDEFRLHYQPILRTAAAGGGTAHVEALLRWQHPERGLLAPGAFLPVLEELPLMQQVSAWVLGQALHDLSGLRQLHADLNVAVNITASQLRSTTFTDEVTGALVAHGLPPDSLVLELTERDAMDDDVQARQLAGLRAAGVALALDDFGTGYSSLAALRWLPVDILKIDRSFVVRIENGAQDRSVVQATITMAHALGLSTVAEGVETEEQDRVLADLSCDFVQGYLHARPMAVDALHGWLGQTLAVPAA